MTQTFHTANTTTSQNIEVRSQWYTEQ